MPHDASESEDEAELLHTEIVYDLVKSLARTTTAESRLTGKARLAAWAAEGLVRCEAVDRDRVLRDLARWQDDEWAAHVAKTGVPPWITGEAKLASYAAGLQSVVRKAFPSEYLRGYEDYAITTDLPIHDRARVAFDELAHHL